MKKSGYPFVANNPRVLSPFIRVDFQVRQRTAGPNAELRKLLRACEQADSENEQDTPLRPVKDAG